MRKCIFYSTFLSSFITTILLIIAFIFIIPITNDISNIIHRINNELDAYHAFLPAAHNAINDFIKLRNSINVTLTDLMKKNTFISNTYKPVSTNNPIGTLFNQLP
jgi:predicted PurR-regulated permease PerM